MMFVGALSGSAQAWQAGRTNLNDTLKQAGRGGTGHGRRRLLHALVVVEFALAVTLLGGAGLTILSFWNRTHVDLGVRTDQILTFGLPVNEGRFSSPAEIDVFYQVTPEYFETFGIRMLQGRALDDRDGMSAQRAAVVNERFVRLFLNGQDPVGQLRQS